MSPMVNYTDYDVILYIILFVTWNVILSRAGISRHDAQQYNNKNINYNNKKKKSAGLTGVRCSQYIYYYYNK
jgi:hypothetical protein